jgi:hypothetical protein
MPKVYGVDVSKRAEKSANGFMHAQSGICGLSVISGLCSLVFSLIILHQLKKAIETHTDTSTLPSKFTGWEEVMQKVWIQALGQLLCGCCLGAILVAIGRNFIDTANSFGMKICCGFEGCCGCLTLIESMFLVGYLIFLIYCWSQMSDPAALCKTFSSAIASAQEQATAATTGATPQSEFASCEDWIKVLKPIMFTSVCFFCCMSILVCKMMAACFAGAKFANETAEIFEDEEYGDADFE